VFFSHKEWLGQPKVPRAISGVIEAHGVERAVSGGRKTDRVRHQLDKEGEGGGTAEGYGSVPFHRTEWTAKRIVASFAIDIGQIRSYGFPDAATELLELLAQWEIRRFLTGDLRLRTACDLTAVSEPTPRPGTPQLPDADQLSGQFAELIAQSGDLFGDGKPITVEWTGKKA
jgi:CRISPR-associated protein Csb1